MADEPAADAIRRRLTACGEGDLSAVLAEEAVADARRLAAERDRGELGPALLIAQLYWGRYVLREPGPGAEEADEADLAEAVRWYGEIFLLSPECVPVPLHARLAATLPPAGGGPTAWGDEATRYLARGCTRVPEVADRAVQLLEAAVAGTADDSQRTRYLVNLSTAYLERRIAVGALRDPGDLSDLDRAVQAGQAAVRLAARLEPEMMAAAEAVLCGALRTRFDATGSETDLTAAIEHGQEGLARYGTGGPLLAALRSALATALQARYGHIGDLADLNAAITLGALSVDVVPADRDRDRAGRLTNLANSHRLRYLRTGWVPDLEEAIGRSAAALEDADPDNPASAGIRGNLAMALLDRFDRKGVPADLDEAMTLLRSAVDLIPDGDPQRPGLLANLSTTIRNRARVRDSAGDRDEAVRLAELAVAAALPGDPSLPTIVSALGLALTERFNASGDDQDLGSAIDATRRAVALAPATSPDRARCLSGLSDVLRRRFERLGAHTDIDEAIECGLAAVAGTPEGHVQRPVYLSHLANALHGRFEHSGTSDDLDHAIFIARQAAEEALEDDPDRGYYLVNLGGFLTDRYVREGHLTDIQESIVTGRAAVAALGPGRTERVVALSNLSSALARRFSYSGDEADLRAAVDLADEALARSVPGHPLRGRYAANLGVIRLLCYERDGREETLTAALAAAAEAVRCTSADSLYRGARIGNHAEMFACAYDRDLDPRFLDQALALFAEGAATPTAPLLLRARLGRAMARLAGRERLWPAAARAWDQVLDQLPALADRHLLSRDRQEHLRLLSGLGPEAAAVQLRLGNRDGAWQAFEAGRGVLVNQALQTHADVSALQSGDVELYERFMTLRTALNATDGEQDVITLSVSEQNRRASARRAAAAEWSALIASVRRLPGLARFGLPPDPAQLREAAAHGAVVALAVTQLGADVLLLTPEGGDSFRLDGVDHASAEQHADAFLAADGGDPDADEQTRSAVLTWLWESVCEPVLRRLGHTAPPPAGGSWPRVWWIPAGPLSLLPLHAAGPASGEAVIDRVISSYTPTVSALVQARRSTPPRHVRGLAVGVPTVPGLRTLTCAAAEAEAIARGLGVTPLLGSSATTRSTLAALATATHAHFACHALTDPRDPSASCLMLADGRLTVRDLAPVVANDGYLAYLSACGTAFGGSRLVDESVHIASALHVAGFAHVIGTLWPVDDAMADHQMARSCYELLADGHDPAAALHTVVRRLRDAQPGHPALWAAHVHVGP